MSAFELAMGALLADQNIGIDAEWQVATGGAWVAIRILLSAPADVVPGLGTTAGRAIALQATLRAADLPQPPRRGDLLRWGSPSTTYRVETAEPDPLGLSWRLALACSA